MAMAAMYFPVRRSLPARPEPDNTSLTDGTFRFVILHGKNERGAFDSAKNHKRQRRKRQSVTAKREKSQTPKFV